VGLGGASRDDTNDFVVFLIKTQVSLSPRESLRTMNRWLTKSKILVSNVHGLAVIRLWPASNWSICNRRVTDLSLYGCGVTASKRLLVGTKLRIRITRKGSTFSALCKVAYVTSNGDVGIVFTRTEPNDQMILEKWISELPDR
jgi:hypothetical protein